MIALLLALSCGEPAPDPAAAALAPWPSDPDALIAACATEPFPELAITCRVQAAAAFGQRGRSQDADAACAAVPAGTWREECHFRAGEELGRAGLLPAALRHCGQAGWFARNCLTHAAWRWPRDPARSPDTPVASLLSDGEELLAMVDQALAGAGDGLPGEGRDLVLARWGYNVYVGSGRADPAPARAEGAAGAVLRTGFGVEAARLLEAPSLPSILAIWSGAAPPPRGAPLAEAARHGRYAPPVLPAHEQGLPHVPTFGGGLRLVGATLEEDARIAALEGLWWRSDVPADAFVPSLDDPAERVRWTAAKLLARSAGDQVDVPALLRRLAADHPDAGVRWHAAHAPAPTATP